MARSSEMLGLTRATRRNIPEDGILYTQLGYEWNFEYNEGIHLSGTQKTPFFICRTVVSHFSVWLNQMKQ
jgi:hypothetical protein